MYYCLSGSFPGRCSSRGTFREQAGLSAQSRKFTVAVSCPARDGGARGDEGGVRGAHESGGVRSTSGGADAQQGAQTTVATPLSCQSRPRATRSGLRGRGWRWVEKNVWRRATLVTVALALLTVLITTAITVAQLSDLPLKVRTAEVDLRNEKRLQVRFSFRSEPLAPPPAPLKASHVSHVSDRRWKADTPYPRLGRGRHPSLHHMAPQDRFLIARALFCGVELLATRHARSFKLDDGSPRWTQMAVDFEVQSPALVVHSLSVDDITCELALMDADTPQPFGVLKSDGGIGVTSGTQRCSTRLVDVRPPFSLPRVSPFPATLNRRQRSTSTLVLTYTRPTHRPT